MNPVPRGLPFLVLLIGYLASGWTCAQAPAVPDPEATSLADEVDAYRALCIAPFFEGKSSSQTIDAFVASGSAEPFLERLAKGAPQNWRPLADRQVPVEQRLEGAISLLGMAISHGSDREKAVAAAYSVEFFPIPQTDECQRPDGLHAYVQEHDFWDSPANPP